MFLGNEIIILWKYVEMKVNIFILYVNKNNKILKSFGKKIICKIILG